MATTEVPKLYSITTSSHEFPSLVGYRWTFHWFVIGRQRPPIPYRFAIYHYNPDRPNIYWAETAINELFTYDEAEELKDYLSIMVGFETVIEEQRLPILIRKAYTYTTMRLRKGELYWNLYKEHDYYLPFKVVGYFDLRPLIDNEVSLEELYIPFRDKPFS